MAKRVVRKKEEGPEAKAWRLFAEALEQLEVPDNMVPNGELKKRHGINGLCSCSAAEMRDRHLLFKPENNDVFWWPTWIQKDGRGQRTDRILAAYFLHHMALSEGK